jgi:hypothetical protein
VRRPLSAVLRPASTAVNPAASKIAPPNVDPLRSSLKQEAEKPASNVPRPLRTSRSDGLFECLVVDCFC